MCFCVLNFTQSLGIAGCAEVWGGVGGDQIALITFFDVKLAINYIRFVRFSFVNLSFYVASQNRKKKAT